MVNGFFERLNVHTHNLMYVHKQYTYYIRILYTYLSLPTGVI